MTAFINGYQVPAVMSCDTALSLFPEGMHGLMRMETLQPVLPTSTGGYVLERGASYFLPARRGQVPPLCATAASNPFPETRDIIEEILAPTSFTPSPPRRRPKRIKSTVTEQAVLRESPPSPPWHQIQEHPPEAVARRVSQTQTRDPLPWSKLIAGDWEQPASGPREARIEAPTKPARKSSAPRFQDRPTWDASISVARHDIPLIIDPHNRAVR